MVGRRSGRRKAIRSRREVGDQPATWAVTPTAPTSNAPPEASPTDPVTGEAIAPPDSKNVPPANGVEPNTELPPPTPRFFRAQMCWPSTCRRVTVWPISPADAGRLRVIDNATGNLLVDMPRGDISKVQVKRKTIVLRPPPPPEADDHYMADANAWPSPGTQSLRVVLPHPTAGRQRRHPMLHFGLGSLWPQQSLSGRK